MFCAKYSSFMDLDPQGGQSALCSPMKVSPNPRIGPEFQELWPESYPVGADI